MKRLPIVTTFLLAVAIAGCATRPLVRTDRDPAVDFSRYHTYTWQQQPAISNPLVRQRLLAAIDAELAAKGWSRVDEGPADIALVGNVATRERQTIETFYRSPHWNGWNWQQEWNGPGVYPDTRITTYTTGSFVLDMFDTTSRKAVWRGSAEGPIPDSPQKVDKAVQSAITRMFEGFPP
ncbi:MAG TPA: DUF4136 domain-containing protein [Luteimonas sp.]|nr:DUF4136 domain-containing protein [Luteimonas sp.]